MENKRSQMILDSQAITSDYIPKHKVKSNFLDYCADYVAFPNGKKSLPYFFKKGYA